VDNGEIVHRVMSNNGLMRCFQANVRNQWLRPESHGARIARHPLPPAAEKASQLLAD
jgi:hypothetical protein